MNAEEAWTIAHSQLELQLDRATFETWLKDAAFINADQSTFFIGVKNSYARDMLQHRLYDNVCRALGNVYGRDVAIQFEVLKSHNDEKKATQDEMPLFQLLARQQVKEQDEDFPTQSLHERISRPSKKPLPDYELNQRYTFDRFIVNSSNRITYEAARAIAENPGYAYNPLMIYGGVGLGKTHLLQAIGHACLQQNLQVIYISSEVFTNELVAAIREKRTAMFRDRYRSADVLLVDDIQFIGGKDSTQEEFFHTFNALYTYNKQIVLASDRHPSQMKTLDDRLRSRFTGGLVTDVQPLEYESRMAILEMWMLERHVQVEPAVLHMVAERATSNVRELEGVFNQIVAEAQLTRGRLNQTRAATTLDRFDRPRHHSRPKVTPETIIEMTAQTLNLKTSEIIGKRRTGRINQARQIAMFLMRELTDASLPQIGGYFGGRSHTTVLHGCNKIAEELEYDTSLRDRLNQIKESLRQ